MRFWIVFVLFSLALAASLNVEPLGVPENNTERKNISDEEITKLVINGTKSLLGEITQNTDELDGILQAVFECIMKTATSPLNTTNSDQKEEH
ncbi:unnamed protein product [Calicophoron daubneyi]|uniref:Secreted protein n=1 Tax=Calicophoron daubneyi TaxID=300641 RepID=A0AAV2TJR8_CALDB